MANILVTGGAGFIGSFLVDELVSEGHAVTVVDCLDPQVHPTRQWPAHRNPQGQYVRGDVRDLDLMKTHVRGKDFIFHQAAAVGVSQGQQQIEHYTDVNVRGTATLYQALIDTGSKPQGIMVAGSMSSYGEGAYRCSRCEASPRAEARSAEHFQGGDWNPRCARCGEALRPLPTDEDLADRPASIYALSKKAQEDWALNMAGTYGYPTVVLRYFNAYGPRQALSNPYTGVLAIFTNRLLNGKAPLVYEDGQQLRDFVSVRDIVQANVRAMEYLRHGGRSDRFNIGSGKPLSVCGVADLLARHLGREDLAPEIRGAYRVGDVRHCFADIGKARELLGYRPAHVLKDNPGDLAELIAWASETPRQADRVDEVVAGFASQGLVRQQSCSSPLSSSAA